MGRTRTFDDAEVTRKAMHAFRRTGYAALSIKDLEKATGLSSGSIYNSFGDKRGIFQKALRNYNDTVVKGRIAEHLGGQDPRASLKSLFLSLLNEPDGCLLTNAAVEFAADRSVTAGALETGFHLLKQAMAREVHRASGAAATTPLSSASRLIAMRLLIFYEGVLVLLRSGLDAGMLGRAIESEIETILGDISK